MAGPADRKPKMTWERLKKLGIKENEMERIGKAFGLSKPKAKTETKPKAKPKSKAKAKAATPRRASAELGATSKKKVTTRPKAKAKTTTARKPKTTTSTREMYKHRVVPAKPSRSLGKAGRTQAQPERRELVYGGGSLADTGARQRRRQGVAGGRPGRRGR